MREYGQIQCSFWSDPDIQTLNDQGKLLFAYLLTGPHSNGLGCYRLPSGYVSSDLGWSLETVSKGFRYLIDSLFLVRCERTDWVILPKFLSWNGIANPKVAAARIKEAREVPKQSIVWPVMVEALNQFARKHLPEDFVTLLDEEWRPISTRIPKTIKDLVWERDGGKCTECGSENDITFDHRRPIIYGGQHTENNLRLLCRSCNSKWFPNRFETVSKQKPIQTITYPDPTLDPNRKKISVEIGSTASADDMVKRFSLFWSAYPKKVAKVAAQRAFKKIKATEDDKILKDIAKRKLNGWTDPQYIPNPTTYLNQRRWEDEVTETAEQPYGAGGI